MLEIWIALIYTLKVALRGAWARLAQLVEHLTLNQGVQGSNPWSRIEVLGLRKTADSGLFLCLGGRFFSFLFGFFIRRLQLFEDAVIQPGFEPGGKGKSDGKKPDR